MPLYSFPVCVTLNIPLISSFLVSLIFYYIIYFHFPPISLLLFCTPFSSSYSSFSFFPLHFSLHHSSLLLLLRASGCLPQVMFSWPDDACISLVYLLMLTHVDICTALWDSALGHISCNDENDDGDEALGRGGGGWREWYFLFSALVYSSISISAVR